MEWLSIKTLFFIFEKVFGKVSYQQCSNRKTKFFKILVNDDWLKKDRFRQAGNLYGKLYETSRATEFVFKIRGLQRPLKSLGKHLLWFFWPIWKVMRTQYQDKVHAKPQFSKKRAPNDQNAEWSSFYSSFSRAKRMENDSVMHKWIDEKKVPCRVHTLLVLQTTWTGNQLLLALWTQLVFIENDILEWLEDLIAMFDFYILEKATFNF